MNEDIKNSYIKGTKDAKKAIQWLLIHSQQELLNIFPGYMNVEDILDRYSMLYIIDTVNKYLNSHQ